MVDWKYSLEQKWAMLHFGEVKVENHGEQYVFEVQVYINDLNPDAVRVELYADAINSSIPIRQEMKCISQPADRASCYVYSAQVSATRPATDYTVRMIPHYNSIAVPLEATQILWQR